ncbi:DGC domain [Candidatus Methanoperedens nitroreducens]|uniref:DGC domain n=1 Tax=Candidatus Methanoperedens nitratireducens TaxID=1392998 RepID=A0A062V370_9EURY|nr:putative zinc-binding protein [Candidatus Methanoperedens nitroreducens]KCZ71802.1 DGC domain [Candidatus Methanoperedens nitroreducens]MDJ1422224.1 putative zinc-binding protein [Candidatus Methanoperedens sp.]
MNHETIKIEKEEKSCPACEKYAEKHSINPPKIAVMACEGACAKGEVARIAANLVAHQLARENTVRICLGSAFTKDTGQRNLVRRANKTIAIEGCFISCSSRMMKGVLPSLQPEIIQADTLYESSLPFGIDEVSEEELRECANIVAETVAREHIKNSALVGEKVSKKESTCIPDKRIKSSCCGN